MQINFSRKIQTDILVQSMLTIFITVSTIIFYDYHHNYQNAVTHAGDFMKTSAKLANDKFTDLLNDGESIAKSYAPLFDRVHPTDLNENISFYTSLRNVLVTSPNISSVYYGYESGLFVEIILEKKIEGFFKTIGVAQPDGADTVIHTVYQKVRDETKHEDIHGKHKDPEVVEGWAFLSENKKISKMDTSHRTTYDHRKRPWYKEAVKNEEIAWTGFIELKTALRGQTGLIVSKAIFDENAKFTGVISLDITKESMSAMLKKELSLTPNMAVFVVDETDHVVATSFGKPEDMTKELVDEKILKIGDVKNPEAEQALKSYNANPLNKDVQQFMFNGVDYLYIVNDNLKNIPGKMKVLICAPLSDFTGTFKAARNDDIIFGIIILLLSGVVTFLTSRNISKPITILANEANKIKDFNFEGSLVLKTDIIEIQHLYQALTSLKTSIQSFSFYIPKTLVKRLLQRKQAIHVGGRSKEITLLFSDIANFTTISENMSAEKIAIHLSDYFNALGDIISVHEGTIDKYIGDAIMAFWGAPIQDRFHVRNACKAALLCQKKLDELNRIWKRDEKPELKTRIGVHTGNAIVGNIGSGERMNYTAIGDSVNLCSRLESLNKVYGTYIIASESVVHSVKNEFYFRPLDMVVVKGKTQPIKIYELVGFQSRDPLIVPSDEKILFIEDFEKAYNLYLSRQFKEALQAFTDINAKFLTGDLSVGIYIKRCEELMKNPPPKEWNGAYTFTHK